MTLQACTELLREHDPERFGVVLVAAPEHRAALVTLYAVNLEIARAPLQSTEPMIALMRLQWWIDRLTEMGQGTEPPLHDILTPLWEAWGEGAGEFTALAETRSRDCERVPCSGPEEVISYIDATAGTLAWAAARRLGVGDDARAVVANQARGAGLASWLRALPQLQSLGLGLARQDAADVQRLAQVAQLALGDAKKGRSAIPKSAAAALYPGPKIPGFLAEVVAGKINCFVETPAVTPFQSRASLAWMALTGRWWR